MTKQRMIASFDGTELFTKTSMPDKPKAIIVVVHGLAEHSGRYQYLVDKLNKKDMGVYVFDHRGHGQSEGERAHYNDFHDMIDDVNVIVERAKKENPGMPLFLIGHSMGGFAVTAFGIKYPNKVDGIVVSGGLSRDNRNLISGVPNDLDPLHRFPNELTDGVCSVEAVRIDYVNDPLNGKTFTAGLAQQINRGVAWLKEHTSTFAYPVLLLHGENDALVSYQDSLDTFMSISSKDKQVKLYGDVQHEIFNEYNKDEVIKDVTTWMKRRIK